MKPFDLEKAKNGAQVCLEDGTPAKILDFDFNGDILYKVKVTADDGSTHEATILVEQDGKRGKHETGYDRKNLDLYMAPVVAYMNVYRNKSEHLYGAIIHTTKEECRQRRELDGSGVFFCIAKAELLDE